MVGACAVEDGLDGDGRVADSEGVGDDVHGFVGGQGPDDLLGLVGPGPEVVLRHARRPNHPGLARDGGLVHGGDDDDGRAGKVVVLGLGVGPGDDGRLPPVVLVVLDVDVARDALDGLALEVRNPESREPTTDTNFLRYL